MSLQYLVNGKIIFEPQSYRIWAVDSPGITTTLFVPASECFVLLIENRGEVLSQQTLFQQVWEKNGLYASSNTLYQNIAVLRKSLKATGLEEDVIKTIPRQGFSFTGKVQTQTIIDELDKNSVPAVKTASDRPMTPQEIVAPLHRLSTLFPLALIAGSFAVFVWLFITSGSSMKAMTHQYDYQGIVEGCRLYSGWQGKTVSQRHFRHILSAANIQCQRGDYAYLTFSSEASFISLVKCTLPIENTSAECVTYLNREMQNGSE